MPLKERLEILTRQAWEHGVKQAHQSIFDDERMNEDEMVEFMDLMEIISEYDKSLISLCDPSHKSTKKSSGSGKSSDNPDLANLPYDPNLCSKRMWNNGWGCQCQKEATVDGMCSRHHKMFVQHGALPHGFYNEERPLFDLTKPTHKHPWKDLKGSADEKKPKMLVAEIREKLEEYGLDTTGKKPELLERLNDYMAANHDDEEEKPSPKKEKKEKKKEKKEKKDKKEKKEKRGKKKKVSLTPKKPVVEEMELNLHLGDEGPVENPLNVPAENSPAPAEKPAPAENSPVPAEKPAPAEKVEVPIEEDSGDETDELSSDEEEFDVDDLGEVEFEGVDYLLNQETMELYSMAAEKIGGWDETDNIILWDETTVGQKAKEFHESQQ